MALPSGQISLSQVNAELNLSPTAVITMNDAAVRTLAGVGGSGTVISMQNLQGKSNRVAIPLTISTNSYNYDVYTNRGPTYSAGTSDITVTINPGVVVGSTSTGTYAFLVPSAFNPGDTVTVVNNGVIQGRGGNGGAGGFSTYAVSPQTSPGSVGSIGGNAVYVNRPTTITNNGTLAGGGGGGGGGGGALALQTFDPETLPAYASAGGGGGGGGAGRDGGSGGSPGPANGTVATTQGNVGSAGTSPAGGAGGPAATASGSAPLGPVDATGGAGGTGGGRGASGSAGSGASGGGPTGGSGGSPGAYIVGNPFVTYPATGTRSGPSS